MVYTFDLKQKVILITGGYGYLGAAVTESLLFHNGIVVVLGKSEEKFSSIISKKDLIRDVHFIECDISKTSSIKEALEKVYVNWSRIDVLINNAFYSRGQSPELMNDDDWGFGIDGSLNSTFRMIREVIPYMRTQGFGKIINVSSMYGMVAPQFEVYSDYPEFLNPPHYGAAKAGVIQLTKYYASYLGKLGIQVNAISPGPFPSENVQKSEGFINELSSKTCLGRIGKPEELAGAFVFLASEASNYVTGQNIVVDGGWTTK